MYTWSVPIDNFVLVLQIGLHCFLRNKWLPAYQTSQNIQSLGHSLTPTLCIFVQDMYDGKCQKSWTSAFFDVLEGPDSDQLYVQHMATANGAKAKVRNCKLGSWTNWFCHWAPVVIWTSAALECLGQDLRKRVMALSASPISRDIVVAYFNSSWFSSSSLYALMLLISCRACASVRSNPSHKQSKLFLSLRSECLFSLLKVYQIDKAQSNFFALFSKKTLCTKDSIFQFLAQYAADTFPSHICLTEEHSILNHICYLWELDKVLAISVIRVFLLFGGALAHYFLYSEYVVYCPL